MEFKINKANSIENNGNCCQLREFSHKRIAMHKFCCSIVKQIENLVTK